MHVVHRDLKPENILLTTDYSGHLVAKLCDFGLSEYFLPPHQAVSLPTPPSACHSGGVTPTCVGSLAYCSPEEIDQSLLDVPPPPHLKHVRFTHPSPTSDIWSLGIVLYAMLTGRLPFDDDYMPRLQLQILSGEFEPLHARTGRDYSKQVDDLVHGLLELNIYKRPDIRAVKRHEWSVERC
jgi:serine/threonine protein kinase